MVAQTPSLLGMQAGSLRYVAEAWVASGSGRKRSRALRGKGAARLRPYEIPATEKAKRGAGTFPAEREMRVQKKAARSEPGRLG